MTGYVYDRPVGTSGPFVGRERILRSVVDGLLRGRSFALVGGPRTGRSSVLEVVANRLRAPNDRRGGAGVAAVIVQKHDLASPAGFARGLWTGMERAFSDPTMLGDTPAPAFTPLKVGRLRSAREELDRLATDLFGRLRGTSAWHPWTLLIDDADALLEEGKEECLVHIGELLRAECSWAPQALVLAGGRRLREAILDEYPDLGKLRVLCLGALSDSAARQLLHRHLRHVSPGLEQSFLEVTGKHPYLMQRILAELARHGEEPNLRRAVDDASADAVALFEQIWAAFDLGRRVTFRGPYAASEHALMQLLIEYGGPIRPRDAERELGIRPIREYCELLEYLGVAQTQLRGDAPVLSASFGLWNGWYGDRLRD